MSAGSLSLRVLLFALGFAPIGSLCLAAFDLVPLHVGGPAIVLPAVALCLAIGLRHRVLGRQMSTGFALGVIAVALYDLTRLPFVAAGLWDDFIPKIGGYLLNTSDAHWSVGYAWRYLGNGGGMGMAFFAVAPLLRRKWDLRFAGLAFGAAIYACLLMTLFLSPSGTRYLFEPSLFTASLGLVGHLVYGLALGVGTLGWCARREARAGGGAPAALALTRQRRWRSWTSGDVRRRAGGDPAHVVPRRRRKREATRSR